MQVSRRSVFVGGAALLIAGARGGGAGAADGWEATDRLCRSLVEDRRAPGLSVALGQGGTLRFARAYGSADVGAGRAARPDTTFRIASIAKPMVGALFLRLRRAGVLDLEDPLARWVPEFPRAREVTLRMLLNHTSGLGEYTRTPLAQLTREAAIDYAGEAIVARMAATRPLFRSEPGDRWAYSNTGYVLLGVVAERAGGRPIAELLEREVARPAGLTSIAWDEPADPQGARGHALQDGRWIAAPHVSASFMGASGAIRSTAADLCRWGEALVDGRVLDARELQEMTAPARPRRHRNPPPYGLGVFSGEAFGRRVLYHTGSTAGFSADWRCYPADGMAVAMVANADAGRMESAPQAIRKAALEAALGRLL
jgi:CubicO group peptidase (beta-lactamase class C family)